MKWTTKQHIDQINKYRNNILEQVNRIEEMLSKGKLNKEETRSALSQIVIFTLGFGPHLKQLEEEK